MQLRRLRGPGQQLPVELDGALVLPETDAGQRMERAVVAIGAIRGEQLLGLLLRLLVHVALDQDLRIVEARGVIVGRQVEHRLEQQLRIVEHFALHADAREQPHGLDVVAMLEQEGANELLGLGQLAVREQRRRRHDLGRQLLQRGDVRGRLRRRSQPAASSGTGLRACSSWPAGPD